MQKFLARAINIYLMLLVFVGCTPTDPNGTPSGGDDYGNDFASAKSITVGQVIKGKIAQEGDADYFKIIVSEPGVLDMRLDPVPSAVRMNIALYNAQQERIAIVDLFGGDPGQGRFLEYLVDAGEYYMALTSRGSSDEEYTFVGDFDTTDKNELNNTFSDATVISISQTVKGTFRSEGDVDYFKFTVTDATLEIAVDPVPSTVRAGLSLYNSKQERIGGDFFQGSPGESRFLEQVVTAETYFLSISSRGSSKDEYTLIVRTK